MRRLIAFTFLALLFMLTVRSAGASSTDALDVDLASIPRAELIVVCEAAGMTTQQLETAADYAGGFLLDELSVPEAGVSVVWTPGRSGPVPSGMARLAGVECAERNATWQLENDPVQGPIRDPYWSDQWGAAAIDVEDAWEVTGGVFVTVGVFDSGVHCAHRDLERACGEGTTHYDALSRKQVPVEQVSDPNGHGTHVAGIIAASRDERGVAGMAPHARIVSIRVCSSGGTCSELDLLAGLVWARGRIEVGNASLGGSGSSYSQRVCEELMGQRENFGLVFTASAGNNGGKSSRYTPMYPATCSAAIGVAASERPFGTTLASYSTRASVDVTAPGSDVISTYTGGRYTSLSGTSMAAPHVAGVAALVISAWRHATGDMPDAATVEDILKDTARRFCGEPDVQNDYLRRSCGYGLVQAGAAVRSILPAQPGPPTPTYLPYPVTPDTTPTPMPSATPDWTATATHIPPVIETVKALTEQPTRTSTPEPPPTAPASGTPPADPTEAPSETPEASPVPPATATEAAIQTEVAKRHTATALALTPEPTPDVPGTLTAIAPTPDVGTRVAATSEAIARQTAEREARRQAGLRILLPALLVMREHPLAACTADPAGLPCVRAQQTALARGWATSDAQTATAAAPTLTPVPTRSWPLARGAE